MIARLFAELYLLLASLSLLKLTLMMGVSMISEMLIVSGEMMHLVQELKRFPITYLLSIPGILF